MKNLAEGEIRFLARKIRNAWRVYDRGRASYPVQTSELGEVVQDVTEAEAQAEAERLNKKFVKVGKKIKKQSAPKKRQATGSGKTVEAEQSSDELVTPELPDYGEVLSEEEAAKYTEGIFEEPKY